MQKVRINASQEALGSPILESPSLSASSSTAFSQQQGGFRNHHHQQQDPSQFIQKSSYQQKYHNQSTTGAPPYPVSPITGNDSDASERARRQISRKPPPMDLKNQRRNVSSPSMPINHNAPYTGGGGNPAPQLQQLPNAQNRAKSLLANSNYNRSAIQHQYGGGVNGSALGSGTQYPQTTPSYYGGNNNNGIGSYSMQPPPSQQVQTPTSSKSRSFTSLAKLSSLSTKRFSSSTSLNNSLLNSLQQGTKLERVSSMSTMASKSSLAGMQSTRAHGGHELGSQRKHHRHHRPSVYPALLSQVAKAFKDTVVLTVNTKDGLEHHDTFTGKMAVDIICKIIRTNDRNLALLLGRSLDAQKFFRDVTLTHRLRDSVHEVYAFNYPYNKADYFADVGHVPVSPDLSKLNSFVDSNQAQSHGGGIYRNSSGSVPSTPIGSASSFSQTLIQSELVERTPLTTTPHNQIHHSASTISNSTLNGNNNGGVGGPQDESGVNGVFTILTNCYSATCTRNSLCYSISCPRRLEQQARLNMKPGGGLKRATSKLSINDVDENKTLWHETVPSSILDKMDKHQKMRQELIFEFIYTERDYVKDLEFMTDFYIMPLRNAFNNIIPEREREAFIRTVFGGVNDLLRLAKGLSEALTRRQQQQKPVIETFADVFLEHVGNFDAFVKYSGNKVFASYEHERQQQVNIKYSRFLEAIEKKPESRKQDLTAFLIKGIQRPARYQLLLKGVLKNTNPESPDYNNLVIAKEEIEKILVKMNVATGESTDRHKIMVLQRHLGKQTLEQRFNLKLNYKHRIIYQATLNRKRDNEKIDLYLFEHALLLVKQKTQNKREVFKVFERPIYLPLLFMNSGIDIPNTRSILQHRFQDSLLLEVNSAASGTRVPSFKASASDLNSLGGSTLGSATTGSTIGTYNFNPNVSNSNTKLPLNVLGLGRNQVHVTLFADDLTNQNQVLQQVYKQQKKLIEQNDIFLLSKYFTRRFHGNNRINCAVPCYGGKKLLYGTDTGVWVATVRSISMTSNEKICLDPTLIITKMYVTQMEVLVEYGKLLVLSDKNLYEFDLTCTESLDQVKNTRSGKLILDHVGYFKSGVCDGKLLVCATKTGNTHSISVFEPNNPFDKNKSKNKKYDIREFSFSSDPLVISFLKTRLCIGCTKGFEILSLEKDMKEPILDEADPSLDFAIHRESVHPLAIYRLGKNFMLSYSEFSFLINGNGWRTNHEWGIFWEGVPQNVALFYPYLLAFEPGFIEIRDVELGNLLRALVGENIRFLHSNEHEALYACEDNGYDIIVSIDFLNLKPRVEEVSRDSSIRKK
ncbi:RHO1 GDP-GTP exchange protein 2 [Scheffersomyces spartinae]|uniref:RHO1 GDP-GTP exchange protein 2 n=1 Tax=Scheffersomyces spartinae TaxID=45513 RepID=A0A9P8AGQ4_9ASCO|nr:RHO1 GDP-GTP exchange protein 2 [Scheffersomyces spartinae]KAG7191876.1 RHO1 GDP-GTP exchange protein 2 [Scheffersomyces spartinae]